MTVFGYLILISIAFYDLFLYFLLSFSFDREDISKHSKQCLIALPNTSTLVKNTPLFVVFSTLFSVLEMWSNTISRVWYINLEIKHRKVLLFISVPTTLVAHFGLKIFFSVLKYLQHFRCFRPQKAEQTYLDYPDLELPSSGLCCLR